MGAAFTTTDPRSSGRAGTVGETVYYVPTVGPTAGVATQLYKYGPGATEWCTLASGKAASPIVTADPRTSGLAGGVRSTALYVTGGVGTVLFKYGPGATEWCTVPFGTSSTVDVANITGLGTAALVDTGTDAGDVPTTAEADARYAPIAHTHGDVQTFTGSASWQTWTKPANARMVFITAVGAGAGGGGGFGASAGSARGGGGGGGSAASTRLVIPASLLPDTLYVLAPVGGAGVSSGTGGQGALAYVSTTQDSNVTSNIVVASGGSAAGGGTSGSGVGPGNLGSAGIAASVTNMPRGELGSWRSIGGTTGGRGGSQAGANGQALMIPSTGPCTTGGTGGGGTTSGNFAGGAITAITGSTISDGRPTGSGSNGTLLGPSSAPFFSFGGLGGAANNSSAGGAGGTGAYGSGGGGGGGGTTGGRGGDGGPGFVQIVSF